MRGWRERRRNGVFAYVGRFARSVDSDISGARCSALVDGRRGLGRYRIE